ncbi:MAG TPA: hypothetical protein VLX61_08890 [Anaerolineales bacterium]|nr:hypothetical protein [Anaerolineales bacterium]
MNNIIGLLFIMIFGGAGLISIFVVTSVLLPFLLERTRTTLATSPGRSLLLGLVNFLCVGVLDALLIWLAQLASGTKIISGILVIIGGLVTSILALLAFLGLASLANLLGHHIGEPKNEFTAILRGGTVLLLAGFTPFVGWFAFAPLMVLTALGAAIQVIFRQRERTA